jgi:hypothetical protein
LPKRLHFAQQQQQQQEKNGLQRKQNIKRLFYFLIYIGEN